MRMNAQSHIFRQSPHFNCQHAFGNQSFGIATGDADPEDPMADDPEAAATAERAVLLRDEAGCTGGTR